MDGVLNGWLDRPTDGLLDGWFDGYVNIWVSWLVDVGVYWWVIGCWLVVGYISVGWLVWVNA